MTKSQLHRAAEADVVARFDIDVIEEHVRLDVLP